MSSPQQILYRVWLPGQSPDVHEPFLTLHSTQAVKYFVEAASHGTTPFTKQPFAMVAYKLVNELMERPIAEGAYQLQLEGKRICIHELYQSPSTDEHLITQALKNACAEQEQVL